MVREPAIRIDDADGVHIVITDRTAGDFALVADGVNGRRSEFTDGHPVTWLRQVHGDRVVVVTKPGEHCGAAADALVTTNANTALSVITADCVPFALVGTSAVAVAHAGWKGLRAGVIEATITTLRELSTDTSVRAVLGPCICAACYEFSRSDLDSLVSRFGSSVATKTSSGAEAFDVAEAVRVICEREGVVLDPRAAFCTAEDDRWYSWRARQDIGRQAMFVWRSLSDDNEDDSLR